MIDPHDQYALDCWSLDQNIAAKDIVHYDSESTGFFALIAEAVELLKYIGISAEEFRHICEELDACIELHKGEVAAVGATRIDVLSYPGDGFLEMLAALRAGDRDVFLTFCSAHGSSFHGSMTCGN